MQKQLSGLDKAIETMRGQEQFEATRKILLSILFHIQDRNASNNYIERQMLLAGATVAEVKALYGMAYQLEGK